MPLDDLEVRGRVARLEALLEALESPGDAAARATAVEVVQLLLQLYGEGLARICEHVARAGEAGLASAFAEDELVSHLLLVHGLHPVPVEARVARALAEVRPYLRSHGGDVELLRVEGGVAHLRLKGSCNGCASSTTTLRRTVEEAVRQAAPELDRIEADGVAEPRAGFVPLAALKGPAR